MADDKLKMDLSDEALLKLATGGYYTPLGVYALLKSVRDAARAQALNEAAKEAQRIADTTGYSARQFLKKRNKLHYCYFPDADAWLLEMEAYKAHILTAQQPVPVEPKCTCYAAKRIPYPCALHPEGIVTSPRRTQSE